MSKFILLTFILPLLNCVQEEENSVSAFIGTWTGSLSALSTTCADGTTYAAGGSTASFTIMAETNNELFCHSMYCDIHLQQKENTAQQTVPALCNMPPQNGGRLMNVIRNAALVLDNDALQLDFVLDVTVTAAGQTRSCNGIITTGVLQRR